MDEQRVGVLGATSLIGNLLLPQLLAAGSEVVAYSRQRCADRCNQAEWHQLISTTASEPTSPSGESNIPFWICVAPIWVLPEHFAMLEARGVRRIVVLSSTSRFTKGGSSSVEERSIAIRLEEGERLVEAWAEKNDVEWIILRPTLIYGEGRDKNIAEITRFIRRFGFFPLFGKAHGLRQPIHAKDVAAACLGALLKRSAANRAYNISGGETITYRKMVERVFVAANRPVRVLSISLWAFRIALMFARLVPRYQHWTTSMAERMNQDLVFDHSDAIRDFEFNPSDFMSAEDNVPGGDCGH